MDRDAEPDGTYPPLNILKPVAEDVWIVDGPIIRFGPPWPKMPFPTRMTLIRLTGRGLLVHSPTPLTAELRRQVEVLGEVLWIVGPNRLHYWWIPEWRDAYPLAQVYLAPETARQAGRRIDFPTFDLLSEGGYPWDAEIATAAAAGDYITEFVFFHRASRTLVLTDLIENFEPARIRSWALRLLIRLGGVRDPDGQTPRDMRLTFRRRRTDLKALVDRLISWGPERVILAHGRWYPTDAVAEVRRAFRWLEG